MTTIKEQFEEAIGYAHGVGEATENVFKLHKAEIRNVLEWLNTNGYFLLYEDIDLVQAEYNLFQSQNTNKKEGE